MRKNIREILENQVVTIPQAVKLTGKVEGAFRGRIKRGTLEAINKGVRVWLLDIEDIKKEIKIERKK